MAYYDYGKIRWKLFCAKEMSPTEKKAVHELYASVRTYLPYILTVITEDSEITENDNIIYVGTQQSNYMIKKLAEDGFFSPEERKEGYSIRVAPSTTRKERTDIVIQGADAIGLLYGVYEFEHAYLDDKCKYDGYHFVKRPRPLLDPCPNFETSGHPSIVNRGIWTWGHKIYDYRAFLDNMARCKFNMLVMWNDSVPLNAKEILDYAHLNGIRIIWGYTCGWGDELTVDPSNPSDAKLWGERVLEVYEKEYAELGGDGVYFQCFTETQNTEMGGVPIARLATDWVNHMVSTLKAAHPELYIQFGIHATSIKENYTMCADLSSDTTPMWEDCGGFPFDYDPRRGDIAETLEYSKKLIEIAKNSGNFGVVLKGFTVLDWKIFEHYKGNIIVGQTDKLHRRELTVDRNYYWKFCEPYWINHIGNLKDFCKAVADAEFKDSTVTALIEDGVFEEKISPSVGLYAEMLWNPEADTAKVTEKIYHSAHFENLS